MRSVSVLLEQVSQCYLHHVWGHGAQSRPLKTIPVLFFLCERPLLPSQLELCINWLTQQTQHLLTGPSLRGDQTCWQTDFCISGTIDQLFPHFSCCGGKHKYVLFLEGRITRIPLNRWKGRDKRDKIRSVFSSFSKYYQWMVTSEVEMKEWKKNNNRSS